LVGEIDGAGLETGRLGTCATVEGEPKTHGCLGRAFDKPELIGLELDNELQIRGIVHGLVSRARTCSEFNVGIGGI
jgi:hypothetical protein